VSKIYGGIFDFDLKSEKLEQVNAELEDPKVWDDPKRAQDLGKEKKSLENIVDSLTNIRSGLRDAADLLEMARAEDDDDTLVAVEADAHELQKPVEGMEFRRMFSNPLDKNSCFIDIQAGAGGTEAQDWASMLLRQYLRYCERKGFKTEILEQSDGEVAGIKTATIKVEGDHAYGFLRTETGVHRLVRNHLLIRPMVVTPRFPVFLFTQRSMTRSASTSIRRMCGSIPTVPRARVVSTSTRPIQQFV